MELEEQGWGQGRKEGWRWEAATRCRGHMGVPPSPRWGFNLPLRENMDVGAGRQLDGGAESREGRRIR